MCVSVCAYVDMIACAMVTCNVAELIALYIIYPDCNVMMCFIKYVADGEIHGCTCG